MEIDKKILLKCVKISKNFKGVQALVDVDFNIQPGIVHGLVGENGAGKSTLIKIISGLYTYDRGDIFLNGYKIQNNNTKVMIDMGVATIYQDYNLVENMSVEENIFLNNEPTLKIKGILNSKTIRNKTINLLNKYDINTNPNTLVRNLSNDIKKMIQIIKAISRDTKILLMDEPTSSLTKVEEKKVLKLIGILAKQNVGIVFISHYLSEVFEVCDSITILRDGKLVNTLDTKETNLNDVVKLMIGKKINEEIFKSKKSEIKEQLFQIKNLNVKGKLKSISFDLKKGEVLGITGLVGSGCNELAKAIFGSTDIKKVSGNFIINGKQIKIDHPSEAIKNGIAFVTDDRIHEGLLMSKPVYENICLSTLAKFRNRFGFLSEKRMMSKSNDYIKLLNIKTPSGLTKSSSLSGGNQQKVLLAKGLEIKPLMFVLNEPTIGIDVGTKYEIRKLIAQKASEGVSIILITSELEELEKLCDRVLIMFKGEIINILEGEYITKENILEASTSGGENNER